MKIVINRDEAFGCREISLPDSPTSAYFICRGEKFEKVKESVYVLMDQRRTCFYVGESDNEIKGGFDHRIKRHNNIKTEKWWSYAICISDARLKNTEVRKWIEWSLYSKARQESFAIVSSATESYKDFQPQGGARKLLDDIELILSVLGVPWLKVTSSAKDSSPTHHNVASTSANWPNPTRLSKAIAEKYNGGKSSDYVSQLLRRRTTSQVGTKWREILEEKVGLRFDANGRVIDWREAHNPL